MNLGSNTGRIWGLDEKSEFSHAVQSFVQVFLAGYWYQIAFRVSVEEFEGTIQGWSKHIFSLRSQSKEIYRLFEGFSLVIESNSDLLNELSKHAWVKLVNKSCFKILNVIKLAYL